MTRVMRPLLHRSTELHGLLPLVRPEVFMVANICEVLGKDTRDLLPALFLSQLRHRNCRVVNPMERSSSKRGRRCEFISETNGPCSDLGEAGRRAIVSRSVLEVKLNLNVSVSVLFHIHDSDSMRDLMFRNSFRVCGILLTVGVRYSVPFL